MKWPEPAAEHRRHVCDENDLDLVCSPDHPWCEECMEDWPCDQTDEAIAQ